MSARTAGLDFERAVEVVRIALMEVDPSAVVSVGASKHTGKRCVKVGPRVPRDAQYEPLGKIRYRALLLCVDACGGTLRCWPCWWADVHPSECEHEAMWP